MSLPERTLALLTPESSVRLATTPVLVGLDGFVDTILHVVGQRQSATDYTRMSEVREFGARVVAAAGFSANFEMVTRMVKLGGNGPIMANALGRFGAPITYLGNLGVPNVHPIFTEFVAGCARVISVADPAFTDAIEFEDGKLMCGKHEALKDVHWENIVRHLPVADLTQIFARSGLIALVNWTMILHTTAILRAVLREVVPHLPPAADGLQRWIFFDLADPAKRTREDIAELLDVLMDFQKHFRVILGLNFQECRQIGAVLGLGEPGETHEAVAEHAARIQARLRLETVVIHPTHFAAAADDAGSAAVAGPFTPNPVITTGAGDHFNAGFCLGRLLGGALDESLQLGVLTSGFYVRNAKSPAWGDLQDLLREPAKHVVAA
jgi:sugar/nucleoside kinase (ribokinase family)